MRIEIKIKIETNTGATRIYKAAIVQYCLKQSDKVV